MRQKVSSALSCCALHSDKLQLQRCSGLQTVAAGWCRTRTAQTTSRSRRGALCSSANPFRRQSRACWRTSAVHLYQYARTREPLDSKPQVYISRRCSNRCQTAGCLGRAAPRAGRVSVGPVERGARLLGALKRRKAQPGARNAAHAIEANSPHCCSAPDLFMVFLLRVHVSLPLMLCLRQVPVLSIGYFPVQPPAIG